MIPLAQQIKCVAREVAMRKAAYPKWIESGRMDQAKADDEIAGMQAVLETLKSLQPEESQQIGLNLQSHSLI